MPTKLIEVAVGGHQRRGGAGEEHPPRAPLDVAPLVGTAAAGGVPGCPLRPDGRRPAAHPELFPTEDDQARERQRLFEIIERLVKWENANDPDVLAEARAGIRRWCGDDPPTVLDPFCGGGTTPR